VTNIDISRSRRILFLDLQYGREECRGKGKERQKGKLLLGWVVGEADALCDVALQALYTGLKEDLLVLVEVCEWVQGFLCSGGLFNC
jgi:hypothetical protein